MHNHNIPKELWPQYTFIGGDDAEPLVDVLLYRGQAHDELYRLSQLCPRSNINFANALGALEADVHPNAAFMDNLYSTSLMEKVAYIYLYDFELFGFDSTSLPR